MKEKRYGLKELGIILRTTKNLPVTNAQIILGLINREYVLELQESPITKEWDKLLNKD